jgi:hypothetical protein
MKLPSLFPVALFAGGILPSIGLQWFVPPSPRSCVVAVFVLLRIGYILLRETWIFTASRFAPGA